MEPVMLEEAQGYMLYPDGRVFSFKNNQFMAQIKNTNGYLICELSDGHGKKKKYYIHRLLAKYYIPNDDPSKDCINHKDENKLNNSLDNLEWCTKAYNSSYGTLQKRSGRAQWEKVDMLDNEGNVLRTFNSKKEAAQYVKRAPGTLTPALKDPKKTCGGYHWRNHIDND